MDEQEIINNVLAHDTRNVGLLELLHKKGANIEESRSIECHFWAWSQKDAAHLAKELYGLGYLLLMLAPAAIEENPRRWNIEAGVRTSPTQAARHEFSEKLVRLAAKYNCIYDGWGTSV